jgi:hypothetical protein
MSAFIPGSAHFCRHQQNGEVDDVGHRQHHIDTVAGRVQRSRTEVRAANSTLRWRSVTPLGCPVVPEVYIVKASSLLHHSTAISGA